MSADVIRWLFCRHNPANNINFGPRPAEELRARFTLKLWHSYAFLCNYACLDGFDPSALQVPVSERPDIDRWILSDLQGLIRTARESFERYDLMTFCLEAERFVDDKLSNWYIRRNRGRFWRKKGEQGQDKLAAYQTLYTVLMTLAKLFAPVMPFLSETMYRNLRTTDMPQSVHLCDFPGADQSLNDDRLSEDMGILLRLVSLGLAARNSARIKVRQPLAELKVQPANEDERRAVERFADQIREELNVKEVTLHEPEWGPLLTLEVRGNPRTLGPKFGARLREVQEAIAAAPPAELETRKNEGQSFVLPCPGGPVELGPDDLLVDHRAPEGWVGVVDRNTQVAIDTRITPELAREGLARDVVRQVQEFRKESELEMEDRIELYLGAESEKLRQAIEACQAYIASQTLAIRWSSQPLDGEAHRTTVRVDGQPLTIELRKASAA
jgi:isoleucyl-tRNA synthetase